MNVNCVPVKDGNYFFSRYTHKYSHTHTLSLSSYLPLYRSLSPFFLAPSFHNFSPELRSRMWFLRRASSSLLCSVKGTRGTREKYLSIYWFASERCRISGALERSIFIMRYVVRIVRLSTSQSLTQSVSLNHICRSYFVPNLLKLMRLQLVFFHRKKTNSVRIFEFSVE